MNDLPDIVVGGDLTARHPGVQRLLVQLYVLKNLVDQLISQPINQYHLWS